MRPGEGQGEAPAMRFTKQVLTGLAAHGAGAGGLYLLPHLSTCPGTEATRAPEPLTPREGRCSAAQGPTGRKEHFARRLSVRVE